MKPELQRIKIAKACGWVHYHMDLWVRPEAAEAPDDFSELQCDSLPDFLNSLDAMAEARKILTDAELFMMVTIILDITLGDEWRVMNINKCVVALMKATASVQAAAFLKTKGLWEEGE